MTLKDLMLGQQAVAYYPILAHILGDIKCAILLTVLANESGEAVYKTQNELYYETGLSRREQETARRKLRGLGILKEEYKPLEHRLYYRINWKQLQAIIRLYINEVEEVQDV